MLYNYKHIHVRKWTIEYKGQLKGNWVYNYILSKTKIGSTLESKNAYVVKGGSCPKAHQNGCDMRENISQSIWRTRNSDISGYGDSQWAGDVCPRWDSEQASTLLLIKAGCDSCKIYDKPGLMAAPSCSSLAPRWSLAPVPYERKGSAENSVAVWHLDCRLLQRYMKDKVVRWCSTSHYPCLSHRTRHHTID